jgi:hypothetical protein
MGFSRESEEFQNQNSGNQQQRQAADQRSHVTTTFDPDIRQEELNVEKRPAPRRAGKSCSQLFGGGPVLYAPFARTEKYILIEYKLLALLADFQICI